jgi:hypothetical protein
MKKQQLVMIEWTDASMHGTEQMSRDDATKDCKLIDGVSAGLLVHEDKHQVTLALDWFHEHDQFRQIASYPKSGIRSITRRFVEAK